MLADARQFVSDPRGELLIAHPTVLALRVQGGTVTVEPIAGSGNEEWVPADGHVTGIRVASSGDGHLAILQDNAAALATEVTTLLDSDAITVGVAAGARASGDFDPTDGTFWVKSTTGQLTAIVDRAAQAPVTHQDSYYFPFLAVGADHTVYTALRDPDRVEGVARLAQIGVSPTLTGQPTDAAVILTAGSASATFTASAYVANGVARGQITRQGGVSGDFTWPLSSGSYDPATGGTGTGTGEGTGNTPSFANVQVFGPPPGATNPTTPTTVAAGITLTTESVADQAGHQGHAASGGASVSGTSCGGSPGPAVPAGGLRPAGPHRGDGVHRHRQEAGAAGLADNRGQGRPGPTRSADHQEGHLQRRRRTAQRHHPLDQDQGHPTAPARTSCSVG